MNCKHVLITLLITLLFVTTINAASTNSTNTQSDTVDMQVTNTYQLSKTMDSIEKDESTIKLEEGNYDSFNINWDKKDKELVIDGNNQKISGEVSINVAENSKLTIKSLTLNHTGLNIAKIINNGTLHFNNIHLTNSQKNNLSQGYSNDSSTDEEQEYSQDTIKKIITQKTNKSGILIINNNRLTITNSIIDNNHVPSSIITNNYIASINNTTFTNNSASSLFDNNAKLQITNTIIDNDNVHSLVKVGNKNTSINPEVGIINSQMSYNQLGNYIIDDTIYSKIIIINSTFKKIIAHYGFREYDEELYLEKCGESILADNRVYAERYMDSTNNLWGVNNTLTFSQNNQTKIIWNNYDETKKDTYNTIQDELNEFQKYFTDKKEIPHLHAYYNTNTSSLKVKVTGTGVKNVDETVIILISDEEGNTQDYTTRTNETIIFNDSTVNDASEISIIFEENDEYYETIKTYTLQPVAWDDFEDEEYTDILPGLKFNELDMYNIEETYKPGDDMNIYLNFYGEESIKNYHLGKIYFSFDNDTISLNITPQNEMKLTYHIPEDIEYGEYYLNAKFIHPEYFTSSVSYFITITNETEEEYFDEDEEYQDDEYDGDYSDDEFVDDEDYLDDEFDGDYSDDEFVDDEDYLDDEFDEEYPEDEMDYIEYHYGEYSNLSLNDTVHIEEIGSTLSLNSYKNSKKQFISNGNDSREFKKENAISTGKQVKSLSKIEHSIVKHSIIKRHNKAGTKNTLFKKGTHITLGILNKIFGFDFSNQLIQVYMDGKLVYNGTCTDNLFEVLFEITGDYNAISTLKVVTGDKIYTQSITII